MHSMRVVSIFFAAAFLFIASCLAPAGGVTAADAAKPNVVFILADDQGYSRQQTEAYQVERCVLLVDLTDRP
jgi:hypothetical protein